LSRASRVGWPKFGESASLISIGKTTASVKVFRSRVFVPEHFSLGIQESIDERQVSNGYLGELCPARAYKNNPNKRW
jgi:hypothetical protein